MGGQTDGQADRQWADRHMGGQTDGWLDIQTGRQTARWTGGQTDGHH